MYKGLTLFAVVLVLAVGIGPSSSNKRAYVAGKYAIELDGIMAGLLTTGAGGSAYGVVVEEALGTSFAKKHIGGVKYEDITISCGTGMSKALYEWMSSTVGGKAIRKNGAIVSADFNFVERSRREFTNALITEISFPALDAASKDAAKMTIKFAPERTLYKVAQGTKIDAKAQKKWLPSNFRLSIDKLDCSRVNKIEALTVKQKVVQLEPTKLEYPNLTITLPEAFSQSFLDWYQSFVIDGKNSDAEEKSGMLEFLDPAASDVLFSIQFHNLGIYDLKDLDDNEGGSERLKRVKAEMYCERMEFQFQ